MAGSTWVRAVVLLGLLGLLIGLLGWHGTLGPDPSVGAYPGTEELAGDYDAYLGERVSVNGRVVGTDPVVIAAGYGVDDELRLRVVGLDVSVRVVEGSLVNVYGVVEADRTVRAVEAVVVPESGVWYTYSVSFLAGLWVLGRIGRYWRVDRAAWVLCRRDRPVRVRAWLRSLPGGGSGDA